ncbi:hypothetical protein [Planobispora longispora]|nr:hypothetical protein [Planobispora longispora]
MKVLPCQGLVIDQAPLGKKDQAGKLTETKGRYLAAVAEAEAWLVQQGFDPWEIAEMDLPRQVRRCWWHDDHGFVPDGWEGTGARPVLIVHVPVPAEPDPPQTVKVIKP